MEELNSALQNCKMMNKLGEYLLAQGTYWVFGRVIKNMKACVARYASSYSSILTWESLGTEEPGRLQSMGSPRVGHN